MSKEDEEGPLSWWARQQKNFQEDLSNFDAENCEGCRWIGGGGLIGAGFYIAYVGHHRSKRAGKRWGFIPSAVAASAMFTLGAMRLSGYNPFSSSGRSTGIDALDPLKEMISKRQSAALLLKKQQELAQQQKEKSEQVQVEKSVTDQIGQEEKRGVAQQDTDSSTSKEAAQSS